MLVLACGRLASTANARAAGPRRESPVTAAAGRPARNVPAKARCPWIGKGTLPLDRTLTSCRAPHPRAIEGGDWENPSATVTDESPRLRLRAYTTVVPTQSPDHSRGQQNRCPRHAHDMR